MQTMPYILSWNDSYDGIDDEGYMVYYNEVLDFIYRVSENDNYVNPADIVNKPANIILDKNNRIVAIRTPNDKIKYDIDSTEDDTFFIEWIDKYDSRGYEYHSFAEAYAKAIEILAANDSTLFVNIWN